MHVNAALGDDRAANGDGGAGAQQRTTGEAGHVNGAVDGHGGSHHVHQTGRLGNGWVKPSGNCTAREHQRIARLEVQRRLGTSGIHIAAREHAHAVAHDGEGVTHVGVAQQVDIARERLDADAADFGAAEVTIGDVALPQHTLDGDAVNRLDVDAAARGGVKYAAGLVAAVGI